MQTRLEFDILPQPDDVTCGPTCLHAIYKYYGEDLPLDRVIAETRMHPEGGTLAVWLACHAMRRGYSATIYTYNFVVFDPTWFEIPSRSALRARLELQLVKKPDRPRLRLLTEAYLEYLELGGKIRFRELSGGLIREFLRAGRPILTGLQSTYLYGCMREIPSTMDYDDLLGEPTEHFVVVAGYDKDTRQVLVADPLGDNPAFEPHLYEVGLERLQGAIMLGALRLDANLLIIEPREPGRVARPASPAELPMPARPPEARGARPGATGLETGAGPPAAKPGEPQT